MFAEAIFNIFFIVLGLSARSTARSTGDGLLNVTISADPPLSRRICVDSVITFTCKVPKLLNAKLQYQWSIDDGAQKIGNDTYALKVSSLSTVKVTCEVYAHIPDQAVQYGSDTVAVQPTGIIPQIYFQYVTNNFVFKLTRRPFNLTATVVSNLNLTYLHWSPPEYSDPMHNRTITYHHGNITTTTFMLLDNATLGDSGNFTLTAANECGQNSSQVEVKVLTDCPAPVFTVVQPMPNFTAVEGYNASFKCSFDGGYPESSPIRVWALFPGSQKAIWLNEFSYGDCKCKVEHRSACSVGTDPNDCCRFELIMHSTPTLKDDRTVFSCRENFTKIDTTWMFVVPDPRVLEPPRNLNATVGSKAVFTCDFEASNDSKIAQIHWEFNGTDLAGCKRFQDRVNCTVTQHSTDTNYISSSLEIYSVQVDNAGQYTCYCSYDTSTLNVDGVKVIQSKRKSATLSVQSGSSSHGKKWFITVGVSAAGIVIIVIFIIYVIIHRVRHRKLHSGYQELSGTDDPQVPGRDEISVITDEMLDLYVTEELHDYWEKLGKALHFDENYLQEIYDRFPMDPDQRLKFILRKWRETADNPSLNTLDEILNSFGLRSSIPNRSDVTRLRFYQQDVVPADHQLPVGGPGPLVGINSQSRILPGMNNHQSERKAFEGVLRCGLPPLTVLTSDLQEEWEEFGRHMGLQSSELEQIKRQHLSQTLECCWAVCNHWLNHNLQATWDDLLRMLKSAPLQWNSIASGLYHYLKSLLVDTDGQSRIKKSMCNILWKHYKEIVNHVNPEQLLIQLVTNGLVTTEEQHMLLNPNFTPQKRTKLLLSLLPSKDPNTCVRKFFDCLKAEKEHSGHNYLANLLEPDILEYENENQVVHSRVTNNSNTPVAGTAAAGAAAAATARISESEIDRLLPTFKPYWQRVADLLSAPQEMVDNVAACSQDPEEQARMFIQEYAVYSRIENIYDALDQLGIRIPT